MNWLYLFISGKQVEEVYSERRKPCRCRFRRERNWFGEDEASHAVHERRYFLLFVRSFVCSFIFLHTFIKNRHSAFSLRKKYEQAKDRALRTETEVKSTMDDIAEHIQVRPIVTISITLCIHWTLPLNCQAYHRNIQAHLPKEMASSLLPSHGSSADPTHMPMARRLPQLSVSDSSSLIDIDSSSLKSALSLPTANTSSTAEKPGEERITVH